MTLRKLKRKYLGLQACNLGAMWCPVRTHSVESRWAHPGPDFYAPMAGGQIADPAAQPLGGSGSQIVALLALGGCRDD